MSPVLLGVYVGWVAFLGAAIGSFLNVVVWRVPEGASLISPPSHCPKCGARIRWFDNVPIFGWILLGGKCRDCKAPISPRYPAVEFLCCSISAIFAAAILLGGWTALPSQPLFWSDWANWANAADVWNAVAEGGALGENAQTPSTLTLLTTDFSSAAFFRFANSAVALALVWSFAAFAALVLGFVEWDKGRSPSSLIWSAAAIPVVGLLVLGALSGGESGVAGGSDWFERCGVWAASVLSGALGTLVFWRAIPKNERFEHLTLGAIWGFCAGWFAAFPGALILTGAALAFRRWKKRSLFGLLVFGAIYFGAIVEIVWFATR